MGNKDVPTTYTRPKKVGKQGGGNRTVTTGVTGQKRNDPIPKYVERNPLLYKMEMVDSGHGYKVKKWTKRAPPKKAKPLDKSKKKGSPRSYENIKKSKPLGKGRKKGVG